MIQAGLSWMRFALILDFIANERPRFVERGFSQRNIFFHGFSTTSSSSMTFLPTRSNMFMILFLHQRLIIFSPQCTPKVVPLLSWRSGVKPDAKAFPNNVFKSFRDIVHFETLIVGITTASAKLGVAGFCSAFDQNTGEAEEGSLKRALDVCKEGASLFA